MHMHFIASCRLLIDGQFPNMETVAGLNLYFDGTWVYTVVACSYTAFDSSYAPGRIDVARCLILIASQITQCDATACKHRRFFFKAISCRLRHTR